MSRLRRGRAPEALLVAGLSVAGAVWVLKLWRADLGIPLRYGPVDDTKFYLMLVKGIIDHGWYGSNPALGAPFGQHLSDFPQGADNLNLLVVRGLALISHNPALVLNLFFLASFAAVGAISHLVLRSQGVSGPPAGVVSVLYALLPYHFFRGESHLTLSAYYGVPLAAYLFLEILGGEPLFTRRTAGGRRWLRWGSRRSLMSLAGCMVIGSDNLYYASFAVLLLLGAVLMTAVRFHRRAAAGGLAAIVLVLATLAVNLAPTLAYRAAHGSNPTLERSAAADERSNEGFGLRIMNLVLPAPGNPVSPLRGLARTYDQAIAPGYCEACYESLGPVGSAGLEWLGVCALAAMLGAGAWYGARRQYQHAAAGVAIAVAVGTVGGLSSLIEFALTPDIRAWNRLSVLIAFFSLFAAALLLDSLLVRLRTRRRGRTPSAIVLGVVLVVGVLDQTSQRYGPAYTATARLYRSDARFVAEIQARLPHGAAVFQLPYVPFPEGYPDTPVSDAVATYATKYEPLRGYLHSSTLRWSYGAIKGRAADWPAGLADRPAGDVVTAVTAAGFDGLWVDPAGFEPAKATRIRAALGSRLGPPLLSPARDLWFFDLRGYRAALDRARSPARIDALRTLTLAPPPPRCPQRAPSGPELIPGLTGPPCPA